MIDIQVLVSLGKLPAYNTAVYDDAFTENFRN
jgi:hypothetical protein